MLSLVGSSIGPENRFSPYQGASEMALHSLFKKYDDNNDGMLNESEFFNLLHDDLGLEGDDAEVYRYLLDKNGDGVVSFQELKTWFHSDENLINIRDDCRYGLVRTAIELFKKFDIDNNLALDREELQDVILEFGGRVGSVDVAMRELDTDENGRISFLEFLEWLNWIPLDELFAEKVQPER